MKFTLFIFVFNIFYSSGKIIDDHGKFDSDGKQPQIFINQSDSIFILAKYGQTVNLPCVVLRQQKQELANIHVIWKRLFYRRASVLSIGNTLLRQDMRYIVKKSGISDQSKKSDLSGRILRREHLKQNNTKYSTENWQFEIRRLNYEDAGIYQCSLPLAKPLAKNITLQVIPDLSIEPKKATYKTSEDIKITCQATLRTSSIRRKHSRKNLRQHRPFMSWYKENELIKAEHGNASVFKKHEIRTERFEFTFKSHLIIHDATPKDSGKYRCIFENIQEHSMISVHNSDYSHKNLKTDIMFSNSSNQLISKKISLILIAFTTFTTCFKPY